MKQPVPSCRQVARVCAPTPHPVPAPSLFRRSVHSAMQMPHQIVSEFKKYEISIEKAKEDEAFHNKIQDPSIAQPILQLIARRYAATAPPLGPALHIAPRVFLSAYLCIGRGFLEPSDPIEGGLYTVALDLLSTFEAVCGLMLEGGDADKVGGELQVSISITFPSSNPIVHVSDSSMTQFRSGQVR